ncbi:MAG: tRNA lysidine(34) synthetase TilS, partial [Eubacteriales bacterium]|nr:tRNA lysidine(34) synthetase TilS [Eubacteriales bacterium]
MVETAKTVDTAGTAEMAETVETAPFVLSVPALLREDPFLRGRILYRCLAARAGTRRDLRAVHIDALRGLCEGKGDGRLSMPGGVSACRRGPFLFLEKEGEERGLRYSGEEYPFSADAYDCCLHDFNGNMDRIPRNLYTKWFDYDKIGTFPVFRTRRPGDRMTILSAGSPGGTVSKKLARVMLDAGIPAELRDRIVLPFHGKEALWVPGVRMGDAFRITPETARILEIRVL